MNVREMMERKDGLENAAIAIAIKTGVIEECEFHPGTYVDLGDDEAEKNAYAVGMSMLKNGEIDFKRDELKVAIKSAFDNAGDGCYSCQRWRDVD